MKIRIKNSQIMRLFIIPFFIGILFTGKLLAQVQPDHIVIVVLENKAYREIYGDTAAPYINSIVQDPRTALFTRSFALTRPSQPNYIMLFSGSAQGVNSNNNPTNLPFTAPNLASSLMASSFTFTGYSEDLPYTGFTDSAFAYYKRKHNPWVNWQGTGTNGIPVSANKPYTDFPTNFSTLPTVSFVIPNELNDMHDGTVKMGDTWLQNNLDSYVQWCKNNNSLFILTFDEDNNSGLDSNHIFTSITGGTINGGLYNQPITHYNVLRTIEELYGLPFLGASNDSSALQGIWLTPLPLKIINLSAKISGQKILINFDAEKDNNIRNYNIQRSENGRTFADMGELNNAGTHYHFEDSQPFEGTNYYRVRAVYPDGKIEYSKTVSVAFGNKPFAFTVYPNPAHNEVHISVRTAKKIPATLFLTDVSGKLLQQHKTVLENEKPYTIKLDGLQKGVYQLTIHYGKQRHTKSFLVE